MAKQKDWEKEYEKTVKQLKALKTKYDIQKVYSDKIEKRLSVLEKQLQKLKGERVKLKSKDRKELMKDREIQARDILIKQMQFELKKQKDLTNLYNEHIKREQEFNTILSTGKLPVIVIDKFTKEDIDNAHREFNIKDQVVYFKEFKHSAPALKTLTIFRPKIILNKFDRQNLLELKKRRIIDIDMKPNLHTFYGSVDQKELEDSLGNVERKEFDHWISIYKSR